MHPVNHRAHPRSGQRRLSLERLLVAVGVATLILSGSGPAVAGSYDPVLVIGEALSSGVGAPSLLTLAGTWSFDDILQVDFPLNVVVRQGAVFVRYPVGGSPPVSGSFDGLVDGLTASEVPNFEAAGAPEPQASLVRLTSHQMTLALPPIFSPGPLTVVLYVHLNREGTLLSNVIASTAVTGP